MAGSKNSSDCELCPSGTYNRFKGQPFAGCVACPRGKYGMKAGAVSQDDGCGSCSALNADFTSDAGAPSIEYCRIGVVDCNRDKKNFPREPRSPPYARSVSDCVQLQCDAPLGNASFAGCAGCKFGMYGSWDNCLSCPPPVLKDGSVVASFCPGFTALPVVRPSAVIVPPGCPWRGAVAGAPPLTDPFMVNPLTSNAVIYLFWVISALCAFVLFFALPLNVLLLPLWDLCCARAPAGSLCKRCATRAAERYAALTSWVGMKLVLRDDMGLSHEVRNLEPPVQRRGLLGGLLTTVAKAGIFTLILLFIFNFVSLQNTIRISSLIALDTAAFSRFESLPWLSTLPAPPAMPALRGLQVRVLASGGGSGACGKSLGGGPGYEGPVFERKNFVPGKDAWVEMVGPDCGALFNLLLFSCENCEFSASEATLSIPFHHSCQALSVEVLAIGPASDDTLSLMAPGGTISRYQAPLESTAATNDARLISLKVEVNTMMALANDTRRWKAPQVKDISGRGYVVTGGATTTTIGSLGNSTNMLPKQNAVILTVVFKMLDFYAFTSVSDATGIITLLSNLAGLAGFVSIATKLYQYMLKWCGCCCKDGAANDAQAGWRAAFRKFHQRFRPVEVPLGFMSNFGQPVESAEEVFKRLLQKTVVEPTYTRWIVVPDEHGGPHYRNVDTAEVVARVPAYGEVVPTRWRRKEGPDGHYFENVDGFFEDYILWQLPQNGRELSAAELQSEEEAAAAAAAAAQKAEAEALEAEVAREAAAAAERQRAREEKERAWDAKRKEEATRRLWEAARRTPDEGPPITHPEAFSAWNVTNPLRVVKK